MSVNLTLGSFLVRTTGKKDAYILSLRYKDKSTHHKIQKTEDGEFTINGKKYGQDPWKKIDQVFRKLCVTSII